MHIVTMQLPTRVFTFHDVSNNRFSGKEPGVVYAEVLPDFIAGPFGCERVLYRDTHARWMHDHEREGWDAAERIYAQAHEDVRWVQEYLNDVEDTHREWAADHEWE